MAVRTHDSTWRLLVGAAPLLGVAFLVVAAAQGEPEVAKSREVQAILAGVAALGALVAAWTARSLGTAPSVAIAQAQAGVVTLRGRAQPLPGAPPLLSPNGVPCLWFKHTQQVLHQYDASDSVRPFLLVDASGSCIVLPEGADITGSSKIPPPPAGSRLHRDYDLLSSKTSRYGLGERLMLEGERIHVVGQFVPVSPASLERVAQASLPAGSMALPVLGKPEGASPFIVSIASSDGEGGLYGLLAVVDAIVLVAAVGACLWH
jgi:hypothetical protein